MAKLRIGIIGAGGIAAKLHLPELAPLHERAEVVLVSGRKPHRLAHFQERWGVPRWTHDYDAVIADPEVDAIIIATPHNQHVEWAMKALAAGKHLMIQKPLSGRFEEAVAFVEALEACPKPPTVMVLPHFNDTLQTARQVVADGGIGRVSGATARTSHGGPELYYHEIRQIFDEPATDDLWFFDKKRAGVGALYDMGVYAVAHLVALLGSARRVTAFLTTFDKPADVEDTATVLLEMANGALATAETGWCDPGRTWSLNLHGTAGKLHMPGAGGAALTRHWCRDPLKNKRDIATEPVPPSTDVGSMHAHWLDCIDAGIQPPLSHAWAARHVSEILQAALESSRTGTAITLQTTAEAPG